MLKQIYIGLLIVLFSLSIHAQNIGKPTLNPTEPTTVQQKIIEEGISLHDQKMYDQAISKYQQVLKENPDCVLAIYEMALSYYNKKDYSKASEVAYILVKYKGKTGILGYGLIANILDDQGKPKEAVEIYKSAIKQLEKDPEYRNHLSSLHYNLGVTYTRQKQYKEAREALKKAVEQDFSYASPNYLLAEVFYGTKYKVPALLSAARLISLEINSTRTKRSVEIFLDVLKPASKDEKGNINITLDFNAPKDEGEFMALDLLLGTLTTVRTEEDKGKTDNEMFADASRNCDSPA